METKFFKIFKTGTHTPGNTGVPLTFTDIDLLRVVESFNTKKTDVPLVIGHPESNHPVLGYIKNLVVKDGFLFALADVSEELVSKVKAGFHKYVSAQFDRVPNPDNPSENLFDLRHVGFLNPNLNPACKGLGELSFAAPKAPNFIGGAEVVSFASLGANDVLQFAEGPLKYWGVESNRQAMHQAALQISTTYSEFSYVEAASLLERV